MDDIVFRSFNIFVYENLANHMKKSSRLVLMGVITFFIGLKIKQIDNGTFISQAKNTNEVIKKF